MTRTSPRTASSRMCSALVLTSGLALTTGCGSSQPEADPAAPPIVKSAHDSPSITGRWIITSFDDVPPNGENNSAGRRAPVLNITDAVYGATAGCNALGGITTTDGVRFYTRSGPQSVMLCAPGLRAC